jgi:hypothetical protein
MLSEKSDAFSNKAWSRRVKEKKRKEKKAGNYILQVYS